MVSTPSAIQTRLIKGLDCIPADWKLCLLNGRKVPQGFNWQNHPLTPTQMREAVQKGWIVDKADEDGNIIGQYRVYPQGYGLITGTRVMVHGQTYFVMALDKDGETSHAKMLELSGGQELPKTVAFTSTRPGRCQFLFLIPEEFADAICTRKFPTLLKKDDPNTEGEQLELRWKGLQSCLPPSVHPTTSQYRWIKGCAPDECDIAIAPDWLIEVMLIERKAALASDEPEPPTLSIPIATDAASTTEGQQINGGDRPRKSSISWPLFPPKDSWSESDWAAYYLKNLAPWRADSYDDWLRVGMAAASLGDDSLLQVWDNWSCQSSKYKPGECAKKWKSFKRTSGLTIRSLAYFAKEDKVGNPFYAQFERVIDAAYAFFASGKIPICEFSRYLFDVRESFWSHKLADDAWKQMVDRIASSYQVKVVYGSSSAVNTNISGNSSSGSGRGFGSDSSSSDRPSAQSLRERIIFILESYESESFREATLMNLARKVGRSFREIEKLTKLIQVELEFGTQMAEAAVKFANLIKTRSCQLDLRRFLHGGNGQLAHALIEVAKHIPTDPAFLFTTLLSAAASRVGTVARIVVDATSRYTQPCIFYTVNVSDSGTAKTAVQRVITEALYILQSEAYTQYEADKAAYEKEKAHRARLKDEELEGLSPLVPPVCQRYIIDDATLEAKQEVHATNPRGLYEDLDEFAAKENRHNLYRGGIGADEQAELKQWDGAPILRDRVGKFTYLGKTGISRGGSIQWDVLALQMKDHQDFNGNWARNLFCAAKAPLRYINLFQDKPDTGITQILKQLYRDLELVPEQDYFLSYEAKQHFQLWQHSLMDAMREELSFGMKLVIPKIEAYTVRLAGWLHVVNSILDGEVPDQVIGGRTMELAIELAAYYLGQARIVHSHNNPESGLDGVLAKIQHFAEEMGKAITASMCLQRFTSLRKRFRVEDIRKLFETLCRNGFGTLFGSGNKLAYQAGGNSSIVGKEVGELLAASPTVVMPAIQATQTAVGGIGRSIRSPAQTKSELKNIDTTLVNQSSDSDFNSDLIPNDDDLASELGYQHTNMEAKRLDSTGIEGVGNTTNSSPLFSPTKPEDDRRKALMQGQSALCLPSVKVKTEGPPVGSGTGFGKKFVPSQELRHKPIQKPAPQPIRVEYQGTQGLWYALLEKVWKGQKLQRRSYHQIAFFDPAGDQVAFDDSMACNATPLQTCKAIALSKLKQLEAETIKLDALVREALPVGQEVLCATGEVVTITGYFLEKEILMANIKYVADGFCGTSRFDFLRLPQENS